MKLVTDSTAWVAYFKGEDVPLLEMGLSNGNLYIPALVKIELLGNKLTQKERRAMESILRGIQLVQISDLHLEAAGKLKANLAEKRIDISARDAHVIQAAIDIEADLLTKDPFFKKIQDSSHVKVQMW